MPGCWDGAWAERRLREEVRLVRASPDEVRRREELARERPLLERVPVARVPLERRVPVRDEREARPVERDEREVEDADRDADLAACGAIRSTRFMS